MINMEKVRAECKEWQPKSGQARYYNTYYVKGAFQ